MIVFAAKISVKKILACVLAAGTVFVGAAALRPQGDAQTASASAAASLDVKLRTNEQRIALLRDCGWEVSEEPRGEREVQIPEEFDEVYDSYNQIQQAQGLDLAPYKGKRATLFTYEVANHPSGEQGVTANLLIRRGNICRRRTVSCTVCASVRRNDGKLCSCGTAMRTIGRKLCNSTKTSSTY